MSVLKRAGTKVRSAYTPGSLKDMLGRPRIWQNIACLPSLFQYRFMSMGYGDFHSLLLRWEYVRHMPALMSITSSILPAGLPVAVMFL